MVDKGSQLADPDAHRSADPLNDSQRRALHALIELDVQPGVIAVSGPPGTGKTAMLRAMIANRWVSAACAAGPCPVILICGATNQSVENVMGTFDGAVAHAQLLSKRWLAGTGEVRLGLTASIPSDRRFENHKARFAVMKQKRSGALVLHGRGVSRTIVRAQQLPAAAAHWASAFMQTLHGLASFNTLFSEDDKAQAQLAVTELRQLARAARDSGGPHKDNSGHGPYDQLCDAPAPLIASSQQILGTLAAVLQRGLCTAAERLDSTRALLLAGHEPAEALLQELQPLDSRWLADLRTQLTEAVNPQSRHLVVEKILDVTCRPMLFHMAARYWEARWLISLTAPAVDRPTRLRQLAMLFPCLVSTLHSAPKLLSENRAPLFGFADLLIIDEAGQAGPELGAAVMSLARQAVVVGDMKQLAPVSSVTPELDARHIADHWGGPAVHAAWCLRGADAATGSVMKLAASGASRAELAPDGMLRPGLLLREHYRCAESIINVCIDLMYFDHDRDPDGTLRARELVPMIKNPAPGALDDAYAARLPEDAELAFCKRMKDSFPLPPLAFYQTGGPNDEPVKEDSWRNQGEVDAILAWLRGTGRALCRWVARADGRIGEEADMATLIAIVTPFRGQANAIRAAVEEQLDHEMGEVGGQKLSKRMTIGTVHTLQGAEKPVVLFSAVNKDSKADRRTEANRRERVFIDRDDGRLLNVAVSRAQKSFILFGHADLFFSPQAMGLDNDLPSALLGRCMAGVSEPAREALTGAPRVPAVKLGPTRLMVVESPHKAKLIESRLPQHFQTFGSGGHIRDLAGPGAVGHHDGLRAHWQLSGRAGNSDVVNMLQRAATRLLQCDELVLGTDNDVQGEAIAWHMLDVLHRAPWFAHVKRVRRMRFQALSEAALQQAFDEGCVVALTAGTPQARMHSACAALNMGIVYGALASRILDNLIGSVYARHGVPGGGRVKGPLLRALAGEGDDGDTTGGRYGLRVALGGSAALAAMQVRLMISRAGGPWKAWSAAERCAAQQCQIQLGGARVAPEPCLVTHDLVRVPSYAQIGTAEVLREAFRRFGMLPSHTMDALQGLYEQIGATTAQADGAVQQSVLAPTAWSGLDQAGILRLTDAGRDMAGRLMDDAWLAHISSRQVLTGFDHALSILACNPTASLDDYLAFLSHWARQFDDQVGSLVPLAGPSGPSHDEQGVELALFSRQPAAPLPAWRSASSLPASALPEPELPARPVCAAPAAEHDAAARRDGAHGALAPIDARVGADSVHLAHYSERQRQLYAMLRAMTLASIVNDAEVRLLRQVFPLELEGGAGTDEVLGLELVQLAEVTQRGWSQIDPDGWLCRTRAWHAPPDGALLLALPAQTVAIVDPEICTYSLGTPSVDRLLDWMVRGRLGRPSTFSTHIAALLSGRGAMPDDDAAALEPS